MPGSGTLRATGRMNATAKRKKEWKKHEAGPSRRRSVFDRLFTMAVSVLLVAYGWILIKVILLKLGTGDIGFLADQLRHPMSEPGLVLERVRRGNLEPFSQIRSDWDGGSSIGRLNLFGNLLIFIPFGMLLRIALRRKALRLLGAAAVSFAASLALECSQALFGIGTFDVDDLILNTAGGLFGAMAAGAALLLPRLLRKRGRGA